MPSGFSFVSERREHVAADEVEDGLDRLELADRVVRHRLDRAERARELELLLAPDRRDRRAVQRLHELDRGGADRARGRGHEDARAEPDAEELRQRDPRGQERHREGGALREARAGRQREQPAPVGGDALRVAASLAAHEAHDALALELARELRPEHRRQLRHLRVVTEADEHVREVDPARADVHDGGAVGRDRLLDLLHDELLRPAGAR